MWKNNMQTIANIGAMTRPQFRNMPTLDLAGAIDSYYDAKNAATQRELVQQQREKMNAFADELTAQHPEAAARIAVDPAAYANYLDEQAKAERDQQYKMGLAKMAAQLKGNDTTPNPKGAMDLRKELRQNNKDYYTVGDAYSRMKNVAENPSAAGDISMIFSYMKMLDPNSTVREGEYATAQNAAGIPTRVMNLYNQTLQGTRLSDLQRSDFLNQAGNLFNAQKARFDKEADYYRGVAERYNINPEDVIYDPYDFSVNETLPIIIGTAQPIKNGGGLQKGQKIGGFTVIGVE